MLGLEKLPRYRCHKVVRAAKIGEIVRGEPNCFILPADPRLKAIIVPIEFVEKHAPQPGGYFVVYDDGYQSFSPKEAFEAGYSEIIQ
jgi:hypothetical protein